jgi:hypothetical protein
MGDQGPARRVDVMIMFCSNCGALLSHLVPGCVVCGVEPKGPHLPRERAFGGLMRSVRRGRSRRLTVVQVARETDGETPLLRK